MNTPRFFAMLLTLTAVSVTPVVGQTAMVPQLLKEVDAAYRSGQVEKAKSLLQTINSIDPRNAAALAYMRRIQNEQGAGASTEKRLAAVILPQVEWRDATLREALDFLRKKVSEMPGDKPAVNFVLQLPEEHAANARVTLTLANVPFTEVLRYIGNLTGVSFSYDRYAILVRSAKAAAPAATDAAPAPQ